MNTKNIKKYTKAKNMLTELSTHMGQSVTLGLLCDENFRFKDARKKNDPLQCNHTACSEIGMKRNYTLASK